MVLADSSTLRVEDSCPKSLMDPVRVPLGGKLWLAATQQRGFAAACGTGDQRKRSFFDFRAKGPDKGAPVLVRLCGEAFCWQLCFSGGLVREREIVEC